MIKTLESPDFYFFYVHNFSQWTMMDIVDANGIKYNCCEQYMMSHKALLCRDTLTAEKIMAAKHPREQKGLGRQINGFNQELWDENKEGIVYDGNKLKFTQHEDLREELLATHPKTLVEASPRDFIWGVGLAEDDPLILDPRNWRGQNLLGKVLTKLRGDLEHRK